MKIQDVLKVENIGKRYKFDKRVYVLVNGGFENNKIPTLIDEQTRYLITSDKYLVEFINGDFEEIREGK